MIEIYSKTIRLKNGKILNAPDYGLKAFRFKVTEKEHQDYLKERKRKEKISS